MKKILSLLLASVLLLAMCASSFAEEAEVEYSFEFLSDTEAAVSSFLGCVESIHLPSNAGHRYVTAIGDSAFEFADTLVYVKVSSYVKQIGDYAFHGCTFLQKIDLPQSVEAIGKYAFQSCTNLKGITLPEGITSLEEGTFMFCPDLSEVKLPSTLQSIGENAFVFCLALKELSIPASVTAIAPEAFVDCPDLTLTVADGSYAMEYAEENGIPFVVA